MVTVGVLSLRQSARATSLILLVEPEGRLRTEEADMDPSRCGDESACSLTQLVVAIQADDPKAWPMLVRRLTPAVRAALRRFDVDDDLRSDAAGEVWRVLFERLDTVRDPERLPGWISVVAANQLTSLLRRASHVREVSMIEQALDRIDPMAEPDHLVEDETRKVLVLALSRLSVREQTVIRCRALTDEPEPLDSMEQRYGIPAGSIGPTLGRGLKKLRRDPQLLRFFAESGGHARRLVDQHPSPSIAGPC